MRPYRAGLPLTGEILEFFFTAFGLSKGKSVDQGYKRIQRLIANTNQSEPISAEVTAALLDAIGDLYQIDASSHASRLLIAAPESHTRRILAFRHAAGESASPDFGRCVIYLLGEFLLRSEWFCQQQGAESKSTDVTWKWIDWANVFYANTLADFGSYPDGVRSSLPWDLAWNLPSRSRNDDIRWPMSHALSWWQDLLGEPLSRLESRTNGGISVKSLQRYRVGQSLPALSTIETWANRRWHYGGVFEPGVGDVRARWEFWLRFRETRRFTPRSLYASVGPVGRIEMSRWLKDADPFVEELPVADFLERVARRYSAPSGRRLRSVLLWSRALQLGYRAISKRYSTRVLWKLIAWSRKCVDTFGRFEAGCL